jgi:phosphoribosylaminoimidazole-succinocarboxamide synthase
MLSHNDLLNAIPHTVDNIHVPALGERIQGKVRDMYRHNNRRILITTDRVSAFDRVLGLIPYKGQVLNQLSAWWFKQTLDIVNNHLITVPDPNVMIVREAEALPVEVVVRGYITGVTDTALWTLYNNGDREPYGIPLPDGLQKNDPLPHPIITPTTKAAHGHDERITSAEVVERGLMDADTWQAVQKAALAVFARGQELAERAGLILVDTKYEFGLINDEITLIDEIHTPDSSRYWTQASYDAGNPQNISKEFMREWFKKEGYTGDGQPPTMPDTVIAQVAARYIQAYEQLLQDDFVPGEQPATDRIERTLNQLAQSDNLT